MNSALLDLEIEQEEAKTELFKKHIVKELLLQKLNEPTRFTKLLGGYSNETYQIKNLVFRFPKLTNPLVRNQQIEIHNLLMARAFELSPIKPIAYYSKHNLLITEFIANYNSLTQADLRNPEKLELVAKLVKKLHYCADNFKKNPETPIALVDNNSESFKKINSILDEKDKKILEKIAKIRTILSNFNVCERPSHGDLHHGNLIEQNGIIQLIDWELSSIADPAYDIARLFSVSDLNEENREIFLNIYKRCGKISLLQYEIENLKQRIHLFEPINYFSIVLWTKFKLQFCDEGDTKNALDKTILIYTEKTLEKLDNLDLYRFKSTKPSLPVHSAFFPICEAQYANMRSENSTLEARPEHCNACPE